MAPARGDGLAKHRQHLFLIALLDGNQVAVSQVQVNGAGGHDRVKGNAVLFGDDGQLVGADLVGHVAVGGRAVGANQDDVHLAGAHEVAGGVVGDDIIGDAALLKLPGRETRPLQTGAGFVYQYMNLFALLVRGKDDAQGGAPIDRGQRAGVAVVEDGVAIVDEFCPVEAHAPVQGDVFIGQPLRFGQQGGADGAGAGQAGLLGDGQQP